MALRVFILLSVHSYSLPKHNIAIFPPATQARLRQKLHPWSAAALQCMLRDPARAIDGVATVNAHVSLEADGIVVCAYKRGFSPEELIVVAHVLH